MRYAVSFSLRRDSGEGRGVTTGLASQWFSPLRPSPAFLAISARFSGERDEGLTNCDFCFSSFVALDIVGVKAAVALSAHLRLPPRPGAISDCCHPPFGPLLKRKLEGMPHPCLRLWLA
jgi:hypothetical protein